jgi:hypothetical protein
VNNVKNRILITLLLNICILSQSVFSQALPIGIDGGFQDWNEALQSYSDDIGDGGNFDLLSFQVSNDSAFLFIRFAISNEILLNNNNSLYIQIDTDNDPETGYQVNGIGSELGINFGEREAYFTYGGNTITVYHNDILFSALPTVTSDTFEIALGRNVLPDGINPLFTNNSIKLCFIDTNTNGDLMPNLGETFSYTFDESDVGEYDYIDLDKTNDSDIRLMTYNVLSDGLIDPARVASFERILQAVNPDIITFNECWDTEWYEVRDLLNDFLPLSGDDSWKCYELDNGNMTCARYYFSENYSVKPGSRISASLIDLPSEYPKDIMIINTHLKCCGGSQNNAIRQEECDAVAAFIKDAKNSGGAVSLPYATPIIISGDLNLVGYSQQLYTLLAGDIVNNDIYGEDSPPDWDDTELSDIISFQTDQRFAYTWVNNSSDYWPGRLDYTIATDVGLSIQKTFTLNTMVMKP